MDINDFFPDIHGNLTKITWAHAVNNKTYLASALSSKISDDKTSVVPVIDTSRSCNDAGGRCHLRQN
jgi:hypothetical protein